MSCLEAPSIVLTDAETKPLPEQCRRSMSTRPRQHESSRDPDHPDARFVGEMSPIGLGTEGFCGSHASREPVGSAALFSLPRTGVKGVSQTITEKIDGQNVDDYGQSGHYD
jgi:hypothetical protein